MRKTIFCLIGNAAVILLAVVFAGQATAQNYAKDYLDHLDAYYKNGDWSDLQAAKSSIKSELDTSLALKVQSYYYNAEIEYLMAYERLRRDPGNEEKTADLKNLLLELYDRYLESYYHAVRGNLKNSSLEGNTAYLFKDIFLAATITPSSNSIAPMIENLLRRADEQNLYNRENTFIASVADLFPYETPNMFGIANMIKAVWGYNSYMDAEQDTPKRDSLRALVNYHSAIALDTLRSNFARSIATFLLATTNSNIKNDAAWQYFRKCLELAKDDSDFPQGGFYAKNYNFDIYLATTVAFLPAYCEYLYDNGRYGEIVDATEYMVDLDALDAGMLENVSKEAIFWSEKAIRALQEENRYDDSDDIYRRLQAFYKYMQQNKTYSNEPDSE